MISTNTTSSANHAYRSASHVRIPRQTTQTGGDTHYTHSKPFKCSILGEIEHSLTKMSRDKYMSSYIQMIREVMKESKNFKSTLSDVCTLLKMLLEDSKTRRKARKACMHLRSYLISISSMKRSKNIIDRKRCLVLKCPLFDQRAFQYGPACAIADRGHKRCLVNYPLGSGKTLSALHAARTFLELYPNGQIIILTTLSNIYATWHHARKMYLDHVPDKHNKIKKAVIKNADWWFSQSNPASKHYNRLIQMLIHDPSNNLKSLIKMTPRQLKLEVQRFQGSFANMSQDNSKRHLMKEWKKFRAKAQPSVSMIESCVPRGPFCLIVDECQEYINFSAKSILIRHLADAATNSLFLSATPLNDSETQSYGLEKLLDMPSCNFDQCVLWTNDRSDKPNVICEDPMRVHMTKEEWRAHQAAANSMSSDMHYQNAYLTKSRQTCNCNSKWTQMFHRLEQDILKYKSKKGPVRIVIYSFFLKHGAKGFAHYLQKCTHGRYHQGRIATSIAGQKTEISTMNDTALDWFNCVDSTCKILLLTSRSGTGISLKNTNAIHIMEPQWSYADEQQAIGRCTRKGSHDFNKSVRVIRWLSLPPVCRKTGSSADQKVRKRMQKKYTETKTYLSSISQHKHI